MDRITLDRLRELRKNVRCLSKTLVDDLRPFLHEIDELTFRRLPDSVSKPRDVGITTTCSCLMSLSMADKIPEFYGERFRARLARAFNRVVKGRWESSGLLEPNSFTPTIVLRTAGFLRDNNLLSPDKLRRMKHKRRGEVAQSLFKIASNLAEDPESNFRINEYPANPTIVYWFVDAVHRARFKLAPEKWEGIFAWATQAFSSQLSRTFAEHEALMDPLALAMAACLAAKLRHLAEKEELGTYSSYADNLPSNIELRCSIEALFKRYQRPSGIWPKYFPLFNYVDEAGSNYCFTFEMLEVILNEFGDSEVIVNNESVFGGLEKAVDWCRGNRLEYLHNRKPYTGWNSGGQIQTLKKGMPESWATAVVHMFLCKLQQVLVNKIQEHILAKYHAIEHQSDDETWKTLLDIDLTLKQTGKPKTVKRLIQKEIISKVFKTGYTELRSGRISKRRSALLFGPPGTSKTFLASAIAERIGWPLVKIDPSDFLADGLEHIYSKADEVFDDLMDLVAVVILFDEMDALVRTRDDEKEIPLDIMSRFLTTCMLPKLSDLHDQGRAIFFMATNYLAQFDEAVKRPARFDMILCLGPPSWKTKLENLNTFVEGEKVGDITRARHLLDSWIKLHDETRKMLNMFTFSEMKAFLGQLKDGKSLYVRLRELREAGFREKVEMWSKTITLNKSSKLYERFQRDKTLSHLQ